MENSNLIEAGINAAINDCHGAAVKAGWWSDIETGERIERNKGELLMLMVTELAEAYEGVRKGLMDDKLSHFKMYHVELVDALIRILDAMGKECEDDKLLNFAEIYRQKRYYNDHRDDHKIENRRKANGKKF